MASSSSDKICIQCDKGFEKNNPLNHVGAQYHDDHNEKHPLKTILEQTTALSLNNLACNTAEYLQNKTATFIHLRNKSRPRKTLIEDTQ